MFAKKPVFIFSLSLIGSLSVTTYGLMENLVKELNPFMAFLFSFNYLAAWIFGFGAIFLVGLVNHWFEKEHRIEKWHHNAYWILAIIFLFNFLREFVSIFLL